MRRNARRTKAAKAATRDARVGNGELILSAQLRNGAGAHSSPKGRKGYNRRQKHGAKGWE